MKEHQEGQGHGKRSRRKLVLYAVGFVLLTDVLTIVFLQVFGSGDEPQAPAVVLAHQPATSGAVAAKPVVAGPEGSTGDGNTGSADPARAAGPSTEQRASATAAGGQEAAVSQVMVTSIPTGATLRVNRQTVGITPVEVPVPAGGRVAVVVLLPGYQTRTIVLRPWEERVRVRMKPVPPAEPVPSANPVVIDPGKPPDEPGGEPGTPATSSADPGTRATPQPDAPGTPAAVPAP